MTKRGGHQCRSGWASSRSAGVIRRWLLPIALVCPATVLAAPLYIVRPSTRPITLNGILSEWQSCDSIRIAPGPNRTTAATFAIVKARWDWHKFYVAYCVRDTSLTGLRLESATSVWEDDCVELYISVKPSAAPAAYLGPHEYHFIVNVRGARQTNRGAPVRIRERDNKDSTWSADFLSGVQIYGTVNDSTDRDSGYTVEMAIPWSALGYAPRSGDTLTADFCVEEWGRDSSSYYDWCGLDTLFRFSQPGRWGRIVLSGTPAGRPPVESAAAGTQSTPVPAIVLGAIVSSALFTVVVLRQKTRRQSALAPFSVGPLSIETDPTPAQATLEKTLAILRDRHPYDISPADVARELCMSERNLQRLLKKASRRTFTDLLAAVRLERANQMIETTDMSLTRIAPDVGFKTYANFRRLYKAAYGISPSDYRKRHKRLSGAGPDSQGCPG